MASNSESGSRAFASCFFCRKRKWSKNPWAKKCVRYGGEVGKWISSGEREDGVSSLCKLTAHPGQRGLRASYPFSFFFSFPFLFVFSFSRPVRSPRNNHGACKKFHHPSSIHLFPLDPSPPSSLVSLSIVIAFRKNFKTDIDLFENFKNLSILDVKIPSFNVSYNIRDDKRSNFEIMAIKLLI